MYEYYVLHTMLGSKRTHILCTHTHIHKGRERGGVDNTPTALRTLDLSRWTCCGVHLPFLFQPLCHGGWGTAFPVYIVNSTRHLMKPGTTQYKRARATSAGGEFSFTACSHDSTRVRLAEGRTGAAAAAAAAARALCAYTNSNTLEGVTVHTIDPPLIFQFPTTPGQYATSAGHDLLACYLHLVAGTEYCTIGRDW